MEVMVSMISPYCHLSVYQRSMEIPALPALAAAAAVVIVVTIIIIIVVTTMVATLLLN